MNTTTNAELRDAVKALAGTMVKVRNAARSRGDGIDVFLPASVRLNAEKISAIRALIEERTGRVDFMVAMASYPKRPNYAIQPIFEKSKTERRAELQSEHAKVKSEIDVLYWNFTRCARGVPPVVMRPDLYARMNQIETELAGL